MSDDSPLFLSALELLAHATEIYAQKNPRKYKFVVLHLANSIELILKDCVMDLGISIYKNPKETIGIWDCFKNLEDNSISVPERPIIELVVDDRNAIQHRFGSPDERTVSYYLFQVVNFFQRFLEAHYGLQLHDTLQSHLSNELLELLGLAKDESGEPEEDRQLDELLKVSPAAAILLAFRDIEEQISKIIMTSYADPEFEKSPKKNDANRDRKRLLGALETSGILGKDVLLRYQKLRNLRNEIAHSSSGLVGMTDREIQEEIKSSKSILSALHEIQTKYEYLLNTNQFVPIEAKDS